MSTSDPKDDPDATAPRPTASPTLAQGGGSWGATREALQEVDEVHGSRHPPIRSADLDEVTQPGGAPSDLSELAASSPQQPAHSPTVPFPGLPSTGVATPPPAAIQSSAPPPLPSARPPSAPPAIPEAALLRTKNPTPKPSPQPVPVTAAAKMGFPGGPQVMPSSNEPESSAIFTMKKLEEADRAKKAAATRTAPKVDPLELPTMPQLAQPMPMPVVPLAERTTDPYPQSLAPSEPQNARRLVLSGAGLVLILILVVVVFQTIGAMSGGQVGWPGSAIARLLQRRTPPRTPAAAPPTPATARADEVAANAEHTAQIGRLRAAEARLRTPQTALNDAAVGQPTVPPPVQVAAPPPPPPTPLPAPAAPPPQPVVVAATPDAGPTPAAPDTAQAPCVLLSTFRDIAAAHAAGYTGNQIDMTGTATPGIYICRPE